MSLKRLIQTIEENKLPVKIAEIKRAFKFADEAHQGQKRLSGEPYFIHPSAVATILAEMKADQPTIIAGLLHDVVEDTDAALSELERKFGKEVANLVDGVTKLRGVHYSGDENYVEN
ncbi:MAG TPA: HD domain-containing protein, partial [Patescibacteria group bacterium]